AGDEIAVLVLGIDVAALLRLADDGAVFDLIVGDRPGPAGKVLAVEHVHKPGRAVLAEDRIRLRRGDFAEEDVSPADFAAVRLEQDRTGLPQRQLAVPEVLQAGMIDHELVVKIHGGPLTDLEAAERIPFAEPV